MEEKILTAKQISEFKLHLQREEKSRNTIEKYMRDVSAFLTFTEGQMISRDFVINYKNRLIKENYAPRSINSMLASLHSLFAFLGWEEFRVKTIRLQQQMYCSKEKN